MLEPPLISLHLPKKIPQAPHLERDETSSKVTVNNYLIDTNATVEKEGIMQLMHEGEGK